MHFRTNNACKRTTKAISCIIQIYLKVRALALFYFINLHHYTYITQIYLHNTSGWANTGYFRCIAKNRQNKIHRNSKFSSNPDVSQLISRDDNSIPSQHTPAQVNLTLISRDDTSIPSQHTPARINLTLISREYTHIPSQHTPARVNLTLISRDATYIPSQHTPAPINLT